MTKNIFWSIGLACLATALVATSCKKEEHEDFNTKNEAKYINDPQKLQMIKSLVDIDGNGRFYEMNYTCDYKLDEALAANIKDQNSIISFVANNLFDTTPALSSHYSFGAGCSAFAVPSKSGEWLMGRNYDFCHVDSATNQEVPIAAILVHTAPEGGKKSISVVDGYWIGLNKGFYTDGKTDLSMLMAAPYTLMDGMNEDGFAIGILHLGGDPAVQTDAGKNTTITAVAMRMLLDKVSTVEEAIEMLSHYNISMESTAGGSYHYFMADATGDYAIVEYVPDWDTPPTYPLRDYPHLHINSDPNAKDIIDPADYDRYRYTANFYNSPVEKDNAVYGGASPRSRERYEIMSNCLKLNAYKLTEKEAFALLGLVATDSNVLENTSHTQWSSLYNLSKKTLDVSILKEYSIVHSFSIK